MSVLMTETSGASIEPEVLQIWVNSMVAFSGGNYFDPNWAPSDDYNTNSRCKHPVVAQGLEFLVLRHAERTKAVHLARITTGFVVKGGIPNSQQPTVIMLSNRKQMASS